MRTPLPQGLSCFCKSRTVANMATGKTHEWVTLWLLPPIFWVSWQVAHADFYSSSLVTAGTWVGGFLLSPDLDTKSRPFYRWGPLRFVWWPYQWAIRHRSPFSHGIGFAPWFRLFYISAVMVLLYFGLMWGLARMSGLPFSVAPIRQSILSFVNQHLNQILLLGLGVWLGSLAHVLLDWLSSAFRSR